MYIIVDVIAFLKEHDISLRQDSVIVLDETTEIKLCRSDEVLVFHIVYLLLVGDIKFGLYYDEHYYSIAITT